MALLSGGPNEGFTLSLIDYRKYGKSFTEGESVREIKG